MRGSATNWMVALCLAGAVSLAACGDNLPVQETGDDNVGEVRSQLVVTPLDAKCLVLTATPTTGSPVITQFPLIPGELLVFNVNNLPLGSVTLVETAYTAACPIATGTAPQWSSSAVMVMLTAGNPINVTFNLLRVDAGGQVVATTNFPPPANELVEFLPAGVTNPFCITAGPDGNIWVGNGPGGVAKVAPNGTATVYPSSTVAATSLAVGPDGNIWFTEYTNGHVGRVTLNGVYTEWALPSATAGPDGIAQGRDGMMYFVESTANKIGRITTGGTITEYTIPTANSIPVSITAATDGNIYFTEMTGNKIGRLNPTTGAITEFTVPTAGSFPGGITSGPDGNIWFTERVAARIGKMTLAGAITEYLLPRAGVSPEAIVTGPDGNLWVPESFGPAIARVTPAGVVKEFFVSAGAQPSDVAPGADGNIWFIEIGSAPALAHIKP
jgi:streptogramin lyase